MDEKIKEWKERWNNGDMKFVPELFELVEELQDELIVAYKSRGNMYFAGEKEWIDKRIEELKTKEEH